MAAFSMVRVRLWPMVIGVMGVKGPCGVKFLGLAPKMCNGNRP